MKSKKLLLRQDAATQSLLEVVPVILVSIDSLEPESAFKAEIISLCQRQFKR